MSWQQQLGRSTTFTVDPEFSGIREQGTTSVPVATMSMPTDSDARVNGATSVLQTQRAFERGEGAYGQQREQGRSWTGGRKKSRLTQIGLATAIDKELIDPYEMTWKDSGAPVELSGGKKPQKWDKPIDPTPSMEQQLREGLGIPKPSQTTRHPQAARGL